jgi:tetratricopeptide (TPR) repeat protein
MKSIFKKRSPIKQSNLTKMKFKNVLLLEEIGDLFSKNGEHNLTCEIYNKIIQIEPNNLKIYFKLAGVYSQMESKKQEAMELLRGRLRITEDEADRKKILKFMDYLTKEAGLVNTNSKMIISTPYDRSMNLEHDGNLEHGIIHEEDDDDRVGHIGKIGGMGTNDSMLEEDINIFNY